MIDFGILQNYCHLRELSLLEAFLVGTHSDAIPTKMQSRCKLFQNLAAPVFEGL